MSFTSSHEERQKERHDNKLPTPESRATFAQKVGEAIGENIKALQALQEAFKACPDLMLQLAFTPDINSVLPGVIAHVELAYAKIKGKPRVSIRATTIIGESKLNEVGMRALWRGSDDIVPVRDNRFGV
jgi:hypothetical protein